MKYTKDELKKLFNDSVVKTVNVNQSSGDEVFFITVYINMFGEYPNIIGLESEGYYLNKEVVEENKPEDEDEYVEDVNEKHIYKFENIEIQQTMINFYDHYKEDSYVFRHDEYPIIVSDHLIIIWNPYIHEIRIYTNEENLSKEIEDLIVDRKSSDDNRWASYITSTNNGFDETPLRVKKQDVDLSLNYNDDLPHTQITDFLKSNKSGLVLLYGIPGSGKTNYIRHLMYEIKGRRFIILDNSVFNYITDASFISLLLENKNAVIILEDCESMLSDRLIGNTKLATLLNLSDGILGDSFNFKFICTFNANIAKLDKAILRKGRLKVKYEFKALTPEKTKALCNKIDKHCKENESLTLAEIYNYEEDNGVKEERKIGFTK